MKDDLLWAQFLGTTLPATAWTHEGHLRVAWMFLARYALDEAHLRMRVGIIRLNAFHGLEETPQRGYHETLTRVWLAIVAAGRGREPAESSDVFVARAAPMLGRDAPLRFYSRDRLFSVEARSVFVTPDLAPLPS